MATALLNLACVSCNQVRLILQYPGSNLPSTSSCKTSARIAPRLKRSPKRTARGKGRATPRPSNTPRPGASGAGDRGGVPLLSGACLRCARASAVSAQPAPLDPTGRGGRCCASGCRSHGSRFAWGSCREAKLPFLRRISRMAATPIDGKAEADCHEDPVENVDARPADQCYRDPDQVAVSVQSPALEQVRRLGAEVA